MPKTKRQFCAEFRREDGKLYTDEIPADTWEEAEANAKLLYGPAAKVTGQVVAIYPVGLNDNNKPYTLENSEPKYYDDDGNEVSHEAWLLI